MGLVEDDGLVLGKDRRVGLLAQAEVGEVQGVVDDDEIGGARIRPGRSEKHVAVNGHLRPRQPSAPTASSLQSVSGLEGELGPVAGLGLVEPGAQKVERAASSSRCSSCPPSSSKPWSALRQR